MTIRAVVRGVGHYLPARVMPNSEFEATLDTTDEWIRSRSGIERRHIAADEETTASMATEAARAALADAGLVPEDLDAIVLAPSTPDLTFPATATMVQSALGMTRGFAYDVQAVCAGFIFAMANAQAMILAGQATRVMVIGAETFSRIMDWSDRSTCVLFGDGAGAAIIESATGAGTTQDRGVLAVDLHSDGRFREALYVDGGVGTNQRAGHLRMQGKEVFRHAVEKLAATAEAALARGGFVADDIDWIVPHQANLRIINATAQRLGVGMDRVIVTVQDHGNTSAASIPLALSIGRASGRIKVGDLLVLEAIGGGLAWGSLVLRW